MIAFAQAGSDKHLLDSRLMSVVVLTALVLATALSAGLVVLSPVLVVVPLLPLGMIACATSPTMRLAFVVFGGLFTLGSSTGLSVPKILYLGVCAACVGISIVNSVNGERSTLRWSFHDLFRSSALWFILIIISLPVGLQFGVSPADWMRGVIPYALFAVVPFVAFDVAAKPTEHDIIRLVSIIFVISCLLTSLSWFVSWTTRRGYAEVDSKSVVLWSFVQGLALFSYAVARARYAKAFRIPWLILAALVFALFFLTGTRQTLLFLLPAMVQLFNRELLDVRKISKGLLHVAPVILIGLFVGSFIMSSAGIDRETVVGRFDGLTQITNDREEGRSYQERVVQTSLTADEFQRSPILGVSPGHIYTWKTEFGQVKTAFNVDSPLALLAAFGIVGSVVTAFTLRSIFLVCRRLEEIADKPMPELDAIRSLTITMIVYFLAGSPFEDKGLSFSFMALLAIGAIRASSLARSRTSATA
ncbi:MAG: hypothetical protein QM753_12305 [Thermomicrobiales bacterium]